MSQMTLCNDIIRFMLGEQLSQVWSYGPAPRSASLFTAYSGTLGPGAALAQFTEAAYPGYARIVVTNQFSPLAKVIDGQYQIATPQLAFLTSGAGPYAILGYYIWDPAPNLWCFELFDAAWQLTPGNPLLLQFQINEWSRSILP